jgi:lipoate-protein ligase A
VSAAYRELLAPVRDAFDRLGLPVEFAEAGRTGLYPPACYLRPLSPAHDLVLDGRKVSGNAQYRRADAVVQHGSVSLSLDPETHLGCFADPPDERAFRERVAALDQHGVDPAAAVAALEAALREWAGATEGGWTDAELAAARDLAADRYADADWLRASPG